jgi:CHAT domain-containing protein
VEWKPVHTVQSATVYAELKRRRREVRPEEPETAGTLLALGDPSYPPLEHGAESPPQPSTDSAPGRSVPFVVRSAEERGLFDGLAPLPQTRREVEAIARLFKDEPRTYLGAEATEENAKTWAPKARYVHVAAHGFADPDQPHHSFLAMTIPEGLPPERENGILQAWEIIDHLRLDADLVVLSACVTAFGPERGGEGLLSLARAFQIAGARTVAATLWPVADESTAELMIRFYGHLLSGKPKDEALREAQMELIRGPIEVTTADGKTETRDFRSPYHWAAFQLIGDWR